MKKLYVAVFAVSLLYLLYQQATVSQHEKSLRVCTEKFERIRAEAAKIESIKLYPFQEHRWDYVWVSNFNGGLAAFSGTWKDREKAGIVDFNSNVVLEYQDVHVDGFGGFGGFKDGRTEILFMSMKPYPGDFCFPTVILSLRFTALLTAQVESLLKGGTVCES